MQKVIIDCRTKEVSYVELGADEEAERLQEIEQNQIRRKAEEKKGGKRDLARAMAELREMRQNRDIFDDEDIEEKQEEVDRLKRVVVAGGGR